MIAIIAFKFSITIHCDFFRQLNNFNDLFFEIYIEKN